MGEAANPKKLAVVGVVSNALGLIASKFIGIFIAILLTRELTVEEFGLFNFFVAVMSLLGSISLGVDKIVQRYFPMLLKSDHSEAAILFIVFLCKRFLVLAFLVYLGYFFSEAGLLDSSRFDFAYFPIAIAAGIILAGRLTTMQALNGAFLDHRYLNFVQVSMDTIKLVGLLLVWNEGVYAVLLIWIFAECFGFLSLIIRLIKKMLPVSFSLNVIQIIKKLDYKRFYYYGKYLAFSSVGTYVLSTEVDYIFISYFGNNEMVGIYAFAAKIPFMLLMLVPSNLMFNVTLPLLMRKIDGGGDLSDVKFSILAFLKLNILAWTVLASILALNIEKIIGYIFDIKYLGSEGYIFVWLLILYSLVIKNVFEPVARALEYARVYLLTFAAALVNIVGNYLLIPILGLEGALISTGLSFILQGLLVSFFISRKMGLTINVISLLKDGIRISVVAAFVWVCQNPYDAPISDDIVVNIMLLALLLLIYWPKWYFSKIERDYVLSFVNRKRSTSLFL